MNNLDVYDITERYSIDTEKYPHLKYVGRVYAAMDGDIEYNVMQDEVNGYKHLRITRIDNARVCDFMIMQDIKDAVWGCDVWAIQAFPPVSEFVDGSNTYHLWTWDKIKVPNLKELYTYNSKKRKPATTTEGGE